MIGPTILFIIVMIFILTGIYSVRKEKKTIANKISSLEVGQRFIPIHKMADPWTDESDVYTIVEIKSGWVRLKFGCLTVTREAKDLVQWMHKIPD